MLSIGNLSAASGVKIPTIRWYEETGLLPEPERGANGRRRYGAQIIARLRFIRHARELGFAPEAIRQLLALSDRAGERTTDCGPADALTRAQLADIRSRIARLKALEAELTLMLEGRHGSAGECRVLEVLSDHALCESHESRPDTDLRHPI